MGSEVTGTIEPVREVETLSQDIITHFQHQIAGQYSEILGGNQALDPAMWGMIIDLVAGMLKNCMQNRTSGARDANEYISLAKRGGGLPRFHVRRTVRSGLVEHYGIGAWRRHDGEAIVEAIVRAGANAEPAKLQEFLTEIEIS